MTPEHQAVSADFTRAMAATPDPADRSAMYAWVIGWIAGEQPELVSRALQEWRQNQEWRPRFA